MIIHTFRKQSLRWHIEDKSKASTRDNRLQIDSISINPSPSRQSATRQYIISMTTSEMNKSPSIAIIGAGIAGFVFAIACEKRGLEYTLYESGPEVWQHGSGIGVAPNAIEALGLIDGQLPKQLASVSSQTGQGGPTFDYIFGHDGPTWKALDRLGNIPWSGVRAVKRSDFMNELIPHVPTRRVKFSKHLETLTELSSGQVACRFRDHSTAVHDIVVGSDGVHSKTRTLILGKDDPDCTPRFTGKVVHRGIVPAELVKEQLGEDLSSQITVFCGEHSHVTMLPINGGKQYSLNGIASRKTWDHEKWVISSTAEELRADYPNWDPRLLAILESAHNTDIWALFDLPFVRNFTKGPVTILGDAAHASTPFQGSGTAMAIEDAYLLAELLARSVGQSLGHARAALRAYDAIRRQRTQKQVQTALETGWIMDFEHPRYARDFELMGKEMSSRLHWLWEVDLKENRDRAFSVMDECCFGFR